MTIQETDPANQAGEIRDSSELRHTAQPVRVLFVGRQATGESLRAIIDVLPKRESARQSIEYVLVTNQRDALREIALSPPKVVLVEVDARPESRVRFGEMVRYRLPAARILAVGKNEPQGSFAFDGYIAIPADAATLVESLQSLGDAAGSYVVEHGVIRLNLAKRTVRTPNGRHHMTPKQCALLRLLMDSAGEVVNRSDIMAAIWETSYLEDTRTLDVHIRWLRECIEPDPSNPLYLLTVRGKGYLLYTELPPVDGDQPVS